jgi:hypothetical protein
MLPNFTVVICGALLTVLMLAVAGSGLIDPQTRTRIGAMPEISRPMMQRMITEPAARGQFAAIEMSRRAEELLRLRDLAPATADPAPAAEHDDPVQPGRESGAQAPRSDLPPEAAVPAARNEPAAGAEAMPAPEAAPAAGAEAAPAAEAPSAADAALAAVAQAAAPPAAAGEQAVPSAVATETPVRDAAAAPAAEDDKLAAEPTIETAPAPSPIGTPIAPPAAAPERIAAAPLAEPPAVVERGEPPAEAEHSEPPAEMEASSPPQLALADPTAVPTEEPTAKRATRTAEPDEAMPVRRVMPRFVPLLPRVVPSLTRHAVPRLAPSAPRVPPTLARHVHGKAKAEAGKPDIAKAAATQRKPVRHVIRQMQHRAQRSYVAPGSTVGPYSGYSMTSGTPSGVQYK